MSLTRAALRLSKSTSAIQTGALNAPFSTSTKLSNDPKTSTNETPLPNPQPTEGKKGRRDEKQKPGGSYTKVLTAFGVGMPLGWLVHTFNSSNQGADAADFVKYTLVDKKAISSTSSIFTLKPKSGHGIEMDDLLAKHVIASVQFKQPQLQIARSYTLLPAAEGQDPDELRFLIRKEQKGEVSGYLHRLPLGSEIELRGPFADALIPERAQTVVFLAGGTGIAPALQVAEKMAGHADVQVLWSSRAREDCIGGVSDTPRASPGSGWNIGSWFGLSGSESQDVVKGPQNLNGTVVDYLETLKEHADDTHSGKSALKVDYFVDEENSFVRPADVAKVLQSISQAHPSADRIIYVSGPEGFISYWAGPKMWMNGHEDQGPLRGVLSTLNLKGWQVVKL